MIEMEEDASKWENILSSWLQEESCIFQSNLQIQCKTF